MIVISCTAKIIKFMQSKNDDCRRGTTTFSVSDTRKSRQINFSPCDCLNDRESCPTAGNNCVAISSAEC